MTLLGGPMKASDLFVRCGPALLFLLRVHTGATELRPSAAAPGLTCVWGTGRWKTKTLTTFLASRVRTHPYPWAWTVHHAPFAYTSLLPMTCVGELPMHGIHFCVACTSNL